MALDVRYRPRGQTFSSSDPVCPIRGTFQDNPNCPAGQDRRDFSRFGTVQQVFSVGVDEGLSERGFAI